MNIRDCFQGIGEEKKKLEKKSGTYTESFVDHLSKFFLYFKA